MLYFSVKYVHRLLRTTISRLPHLQCLELATQCPIDKPRIMSFWREDKEKGIQTWYWVFLRGVSLDFDSSWTGSEVKILRKAYFSEWSKVAKGCRRWAGPRSLEWVPSTHCFVNHNEDILVGCGEGNGVPPHTSVIAGWEDVAALAQGGEYKHGIARLEINRDFRFGASTVRLIVRKVSRYYGDLLFKLSVVVENIRRDEWDKLLEYQQYVKNGRDDVIAEDVPYTWRGNERVIEQTPESPWQNNANDVTDNIRHVAHESLSLVFKYVSAQNEAIQRGLSLDDFLWEFPNHNGTRVVRRPSAQTDTPLRALRLDISIQGDIWAYDQVVYLHINSIELEITQITRSPSHPNTFSSCTLRLDTPYAALANATIPNHSSQIIEISPDSQLVQRVITTSSPIHVNGTLQIMGSVMGDMFAAPIYGGNVGGQNNTNHFTAPPTVEEVVSAVMQVMRSAPNSGVPQTEGRRKRTRARAMYDDDAGVDVEPPKKRRARRSRA
ncbi:hypothetical protein AB1N83_010114 [Pleurotus pulmonarius]